MTPPLTEDLPDLPTSPTGTPGAPGAPKTPGTTSPDDAAGDAEPRSKLLDLSLTQLIGGSMAAATAAALGSRLGVVGTITGAAVLSVVSAIAGTVYTNSMARARDAVVFVRSRGGVVPGRPTPAVPLLAASPMLRRGWSRPDRPTGRRALLTAGAVFALAAAFLAGLQLATGAPVTRHEPRRPHDRRRGGRRVRLGGRGQWREERRRRPGAGPRRHRDGHPGRHLVRQKSPGHDSGRHLRDRHPHGAGGRHGTVRRGH